jgi:biofilm PGA synthesis N-glycosyltransferase PgaC
MAERPGYEVIVPFHDEFEGAVRTARSLADVSPPPERILLVDDGSAVADHPAQVLPDNAELIRLPTNRGKAAALNQALGLCRAEIVLTIDSDTQALTDDFGVMLSHFADPDVCAVTGKIWPRISGRLIEQLQALDYLAVICLIKAAESQWHGLTTISGAWTAFRRETLVAMGLFRENVAAEDIEMSWRTQNRGMRILYESRWIGSVEMVPTWRGLLRQRRRWSAGLGRALRDHYLGAFGPRSYLTPLALLNTTTLLWVSLVFAGSVSVLIDTAIAWARSGSFEVANSALLGFGASYWGIAISAASIQLGTAIVVDHGPWRRYPAMLLVAPLYPVYFWFVLFPSFVLGMPTGLARRDRGLWKRSIRARELGSEGLD